MHIEHRSLFPLCLALSWLIAGQACAQSPQAQSKTAIVQLVSDTCPVVHTGDQVAFDWNPVFDPEWPVTGIGSVSLQFARQEEDGVNLRMRPLYTLGGRISQSSSTAIGNGFYRIAIVVPLSREMTPGVYRLVGVQMNARVQDDYSGPASQMTLSPVESRYCITLRGAQ